MAYRDENRSMMDSLSIYPLPYPVLLILAVASLFMMTSWYFSFEEAAETAGERMNVALLLIPLLLVVIVRFLSSMENPDAILPLLGMFSSRRQIYVSQGGEGGGSSPWGVAAVIVMILVLVKYQSTFLEMWFG